MLTGLLLFSNMSTNTRMKQEVKRMFLNGVTCRGTHQVKKKSKNCNVHISFSILIHNHAKSFNSKGNRMRSKKYWNNELQLQWNKVCEKERLWPKCTNGINRNVLKDNYCAERRPFDQMNRRYKRQHQRTNFSKANFCDDVFYDVCT